MKQPERPLRLLSIGGLRGFTSTCLVRRAVERGHEVTILTRGVRAEQDRTDANLPAGVEVIVGNRSDDHAWAEGREWDAAVDFGAFHPDDVDAIAAALRGRVRHYTLISTIVTYRQDPGVIDEDSPLLEEPELAFTAAAGPNSLVQYGRGKVLAERRAAEFGARVLIVRPGMIAGPGDPMDHLQYWYDRWARGGDIAAAGEPGDPVQFADSRDLGAWLLEMIERDRVGTFNTAGPHEPLTMGELLAIIGRELGDDREPVWLPWEWLEARGVPDRNGPLQWMKPDELRDPDEFWVSLRISDERARAEGYRPRPAAETVRDTIAAFRALPEEAKAATVSGWPGGVDEEDLVAAWRSEQSASR